MDLLPDAGSKVVVMLYSLKVALLTFFFFVGASCQVNDFVGHPSSNSTNQSVNNEIFQCKLSKSRALIEEKLALLVSGTQAREAMELSVEIFGDQFQKTFFGKLENGFFVADGLDQLEFFTSSQSGEYEIEVSSPKEALQAFCKVVLFLDQELLEQGSNDPQLITDGNLPQGVPGEDNPDDRINPLPPSVPTDNVDVKTVNVSVVPPTSDEIQEIVENATIPQCTNGRKLYGPNLLFVVDNSSSNAQTDCPDRKPSSKFAKIGDRTFATYECGNDTNRSAAVRTGVALLKKAIAEAGQTSGDTGTAAQMSIVSFPTLEDYQKGAARHGEPWMPLNDQSLNIDSLMSFVRTPFGLTPYAAGLREANLLFSDIPQADKRKQLIIFITDGEPTDREPLFAGALARDLRSQGVKIVIVFVNNGQTRLERQVTHREDLLRKHNILQTRQPKETWWLEPGFTSFESYFNILVGTPTIPSLVEEMTLGAKVTCQADASECVSPLVDISQSNDLVPAINQVILNEGFVCR